MPTMLFLRFVAKALANAFGGGVAGDLLFEVLPDVAGDVWSWWRAERREDQLRTDLEAVVQAEASALRAAVRAIVQEEAATRPAVERRQIELYLTHIPSAMRRSLRRPADPTGVTVPPTLLLRQASDLLYLLPLRLPRFQPGDWPLSGVDLQLEELLGVGGFGEVWKACNPYLRNEPPVALKFCHDPTTARSLRNEATLLDRVRSQGVHPGIVQLRQTYLRAEIPALAYEYVAGGDLAGLIRAWQHTEQAPTPAEIAYIILRLARIIGFAHKAQPPIVHRDLKPANILVVASSEKGFLTKAQWLAADLKITDFGIGGLVVEKMQRESLSSAGLTQRPIQTLIGSYTPLYASPQQMRDAAPTPCDDVYALGVIWWQLLIGDLSAGRPGGRHWQRRLREQGMSVALIELLADCFEENPTDRPTDANILATRLNDALNGPLLSFSVQSTELPISHEQSSQPALVEPASGIGEAFAPADSRRLSILVPSVGQEKTIILADIAFPFVYVPAGSFTMGSTDVQDEKPIHTMHVDAFWLLKTPVTNTQFRPFVESGGYTNQTLWTTAGWQWRIRRKIQQPRHWEDRQWGTPQQPVIGVSWYEATAYTNWLAQTTDAIIRLPTEAEWEKAARGVDGRTYPWGDAAPDQSHCNFADQKGKTTPVGNYPAGVSPYGALDMAGNVWEWIGTHWVEDYVNYANVASHEKEGNGLRSLRGGSWGHPARNLRAANRRKYKPDPQSYHVGFRVVLLSSL